VLQQKQKEINVVLLVELYALQHANYFYILRACASLLVYGALHRQCAQHAAALEGQS
jgi:hypothetical protein